MPRAKGGTKTRARHKKRLKLAKGYYGAKSRLFRTATEAVDRARQYAYRDRRNRKRDFRRLWIARITAACRSHGILYSRIIYPLKKAGVALARKVVSVTAIQDPGGFTKLVDPAKAQLAKA